MPANLRHLVIPITLNQCLRHYLTVKTGEIPNVREVYEAFKQYARSKVRMEGIEALVADIRAFAGYYCAMALGAEEDAELTAAFHDFAGAEDRCGISLPS